MEIFKMSPEEKIRNYFKKTEKGVKFHRNKNYFSCLSEQEEGHWVCDNPLFVSDDQGLFPVYRTGGRQGVMNKNYHEFILKGLPTDFKKEKNKDYKNVNKGAKNVLTFEEKI